MIGSDLTLQQYNLLKRSCRYLEGILDAVVTTLRSKRTVKAKYLLRFPKLREFYGVVKVRDWDSLEKLTLTRGQFVISAKEPNALPGLYYKKILDSELRFQDLTLNIDKIMTWRFYRGNHVRLNAISYNPNFSAFIGMLVKNHYRISFSFKGCLGAFCQSCRNYPKLYQNFERLRLTVASCNRLDWIGYIENHFLPHYSYCYGMSPDRGIYPNVLKVYSDLPEKEMTNFPNATFTLVERIGKYGKHTMIMSNTDLLG